jgi:hypothetical protein
MQILGLAESTPKPENRLKSLFWPRVRYQEDVDYIGVQGFWVCCSIAFFTLLLAFVVGIRFVIVDAVYFYLAGVGIRQRSRFAAVSALGVYLFSRIANLRLTHPASVVSIIFLALLLTNVRAIWLAARWEATGTGPTDPPRMTGLPCEYFPT